MQVLWDMHCLHIVSCHSKKSNCKIANRPMLYLSALVQLMAQFTSLGLEISLILSHLLWGELVHFLQLMPFTIFHFSFNQVPITAGWTEAAWYERLAQNLCTWPAVWLEHRSHNQVLTGLALLDFSDLTGTGYHAAMCYYCTWSLHCTLCHCIWFIVLCS